MKMKRRVFSLLVLFMVGGMPALSWTAEKPSAPITLRWLDHGPKTALDPATITQEWFADQLEKRTNGRYKVKIYWGGTVAGAMEMPWAVRDGLGDFGPLVCAYFQDHFWLNSVGGFVMPMGLRQLELGKTMFFLHERYPQFIQEFTEKGLKCIGFRPLEP